MRRLGMLTGEHRRRPVPAAEVANGSSWARAPIDGILRPQVRLGARVARGELLGRVADPFGNAEGEVRAVADGIVIGMSRLPLANEGEALFHIARFDAIEEAESAIEDFQSSLEPPPTPSTEPPGRCAPISSAPMRRRRRSLGAVVVSTARRRG